MSKTKATEPIQCECGFRIWDGEVVRSRVLRIREDQQFEAKCRCKRWIALPVALKEDHAVRPRSLEEYGQRS